jgi:STE24 endopeptidase
MASRSLPLAALILTGALVLAVAEAPAQSQRPDQPELQSLIADTTAHRPSADTTIAADGAAGTPGLTREERLARADSIARAAQASLDSLGASPGYVAELRAGFTSENRAYWTTRVVLEIAALLLGIAAGFFLLFSGWSARLRDVAMRARGRYLRTLVYFALYSATMFLLFLPLAVYSGWILERQYDLTTQSFGGWIGDELKGLLVSIVFLGGTGLVALAYLAIERHPRRWWLHLAVGSIPVVIVSTLIQPILIDPLFNRFEPLRDEQLRARIVALAAEAGIPGRNVYEVDKSKQTKKYNAYVSGFGASQRIVLWDTILAGMDDDELLFVMGHEMGHYRLGHIWKGIAFFSVLAFAVFFGCGVFMTWATRRFGPRWGFRELHDLASMPLFAIALSLAGLVAQPMVNAYSRSIEREADTFGLEVTRLNDAAARAFVKLAAQNRSNPEPPLLLEWFQYSHPPVVQRVTHALVYRPWEAGQPNRKFHPAPREPAAP